MSVGFPDYRRGQAAASPALITFAGNVDVNNNFPAFDTSAWPYVSFLIDTSVSASFYNVAFRWNNSPTLTDFIAEDIVTFAANTVSAIHLAVRAPYCQILVVNLTGEAGQALKIFGYGTVSSSDVASPAQKGAPLALVNQSIAANTTITISGLPTAPGRAVLVGNNSAAADWRINLLYYDFTTRSYTGFYRFFPNGTVIPQFHTAVVMLPPAPVELQVINNDAGAHTFIASLVVG